MMTRTLDMRKKRCTRSERIFDLCNAVVMGLIIIACAYPVYYTVIASFSNPNLVIGGKVYFWIREFTLESYREVMKYRAVLIGYRNTLLYTSAGTLLNLLFLIPASYALSKQEVKGRRMIMLFFVFTMYFGGGMIPTYLQYREFGLINNPWVLILPDAFSVYNMLITRSYFESNFSETLAEAARIDGAGELRIFWQLALPLSGAIIAVMALFHAVAHWNSYFNALLYIRDTDYYPLQLVMRQILMTTQNIGGDVSMAGTDELVETARRIRVAQTMKYALVILANLPVLVAYPFVQKYFVKGVMIGTIKG